MNIVYISWNRRDAVQKVTRNLIKTLIKNQYFNSIKLKMNTKNKFLRSFDILRGIAKISPLFFSKKIIHFEESRQFEPIINALFRKNKSVVTVHHVGKKNYWLDFLFILEKIVHKSFSKLIAISEKTKQDLIEIHNIKPEKITVVYNGLDHEVFKPTKKKVNSLKNKKYILYLGSEIPRKNIENLLKAFKEISKKYPDLYLVKAGYSGGDEYREKTKKLIKELELSKKVIIVSKRLKEEELPIYYSNAEIFVYPTLQEGFGMPLVESMACGCPVVTSDIAPMNEIANNQELVNPHNYKGIAKGMNKVLSNKEYKTLLIKKGLQRAKDFDWKKSANKILDVYEELEKENGK
jgi:glycosyltransferase involved in cell wall biosynthesis